MSNKNRKKSAPAHVPTPANASSPADVVMTELGAQGEANVTPLDPHYGRRRRVEYRFLPVGQHTPAIVQEALNAAAQDGWRVVCTISNHLLLERELDREG